MKSLYRILEEIYQSCHQIPNVCPADDSFLEHIVNSFKDPECLREMSNLRQRSTGLPMIIWVDEIGSYKNAGHSKRLKFQKDYSQKYKLSNQGSIRLDNCEFVESTLSGNKLTAKDMVSIQTFVKNNQKALNLLSDQEIDIKDFFDVMISGGDLASESEIKDQNEKLDNILRGYE